MESRALQSPPSILPLYARAAAPLIPGASLLPFIPGRGRGIPEIELSLAGATPDPDAVAAFARVCGLSLRDHLPPTYPHVLAFPLQMAVMADGRFPFGAIGLVHVENRIVQRRQIGIGEELSITVRPTQLQRHPKGRIFSLLTEVQADEELAWQSTSTMLHRTKQPADGPIRQDSLDVSAHRRGEELRGSAEWKLPGDLGRRYGGASGDRNPIHMHSLAAKPLGFPRAIAHGMWTKARCLAALESRLPDDFEVSVRFRKPILLPGRVEFASAGREDGIDFAVRDPKRGTPHLDGRLGPIEPKTEGERRNAA
jgi:acyl dehydratase